LPPQEQVARGKELLQMLQVSGLDAKSELTSPFPDASSLPIFRGPFSAAPLRQQAQQAQQQPPLQPSHHQQQQVMTHHLAAAQLSQPSSLRSSCEASSRQVLQHEAGWSAPAQPLFPSRPSMPAPASGPSPTAAAPPGVWGMGNMEVPPAQGACWLSTNPGGTSTGMSNWLSTGVSDCDGSAVSVNAALGHEACIRGSAGAGHLVYSSLSSPAIETRPQTHAPWASPANLVPSMAVNAMMPMAMSSHWEMDKPNGNQLRAEAAQFIPGASSMGLQVY